MFFHKFKLILVRHTLIEPICDICHWSLALMIINTLYLFDFMHHNHVHETNKYYRLLEKVWSSYGKWKWATNRRTSHVEQIPQYRGNWECAYFTMKCAITYIKGVCKFGFSLDKMRDL